MVSCHEFILVKENFKFIVFFMWVLQLMPSGTVRLIRSIMLVLRERQHQNQRRVPERRKQCGSGTDEGTGSRPGVSDVPSDDSEEELSWNSSDDEDVDEQTKGREESEGD
nr:hypothetical protein [Tanacetum cinerariifolium]